MAVVIIAGVAEAYIQIWSERRDVYITGRPIQGSTGVIGKRLAAGIIGRHRRKHHSAAGIRWDNDGRKIWRAPIKRMFKIKINY